MFALTSRSDLYNHSINDYNVNLHAFGQQILRLPKHDQKLRKLGLECFFMSRDAYERLLRRLVLNSTKRIRWLTATATGASTVPEEPSILDRVSVRLPDGTKQDIPASLVIGKHRARYQMRSECATKELLSVRRLLRRYASWPEVDSADFF